MAKTFRQLVGKTFEEYAEGNLHIRDKVGSIGPWRLNPVQHRILAKKREAVAKGRKPWFLELKYRRGGISTLETGQNFERVSTRTGQTAVTLAHTDKSTDILFRIASLFYERLHPAMRPFRQRDNAKRLDFRNLRSLYYVGTAGGQAFGRGDTIQRVHWSEVAWSRHNPGLLEGLKEACSHGSVNLETTANGPKGEFYELFKDSMLRYSEWTPIFLPWFIDPTNVQDLAEGEEIVPGVPHLPDFPMQFCEREPDLIDMAFRDYGVAISQGQLKWRRHKWAGTKPNPHLFAQEYPETWQEAFVASASLFFDQAMLSVGSMMARDPQHREDQDRFWAWEEPRVDEDGRPLEYIAGADCSEGRPNGDASYLSIHEAKTGRQVARWHGRVEPHVFGGEIIPRYCRRYHDAFVGIERNNHGHAVILACSKAGYRKLYKHRRASLDKREPEEVYGWETNGQTRVGLLDGLKAAMTDGWLCVMDPGFWSECYTFEDDSTDEERRKNREAHYSASSGNHDDRIFGVGIALEVRRLRRRPGIR